LPDLTSCASAWTLYSSARSNGLSGDALRHQPGQRQADRPQQQQRREHPVEDLAEQRALFALEQLERPFFGLHGLTGHRGDRPAGDRLTQLSS
jgi:hypothetical protein